MIYTIILLILVSGLVAYLGDWIGRRMGKRRLRLFGMRPRHTAILVTTVTGMLIATITFGTLMTIDSRLRSVLTRGLQLAEDNRRLAEKNASYLERNETLHKLNMELLNQSSKLSREVQEKTAQVTKARKQATDALRARELAQLQIRGLSRLIDIRQRELDKLRRTGKATENRLNRISQSLAASTADLRRIKAELNARNERLDTIQNDLDARVAELETKRAELDEAKKDIQTAEATIDLNRDIIRKQQAEIANEIDRNKKLYTKEWVLADRTEICRRVVDGDLPPSELRKEIIGLLENASDRARTAGAGEDADKRAVRLVYVDKYSRDIVSADEDDCIDAVVRTISSEGRTGPADGVFVIVNVVRNTLKGETGLVSLQLRWNKLSFHRGDNIARGLIDGRQSEGRVLLAIMDFLSNNVRAAAENGGVFPVATSDPDEAAAPISDEQLDRLIELVETIRGAGKQVELKAVADKDIYAAGPIDLDSIGFSISTLVTAER